jgi:Sec-independent protein secretion pathway component TatC
MGNKNARLDFKFQPELRSNLNLELLFTEHIEELRQRSLHVLIALLLLSCTAFLNVKPIVHLLEIPVQNVKFFQLSPGDYFISTVKIAVYTGILSTSPFFTKPINIFCDTWFKCRRKKINITITNWINSSVFP